MYLVNEETKNELYHHGILGMKWGHHKSGLQSYMLSKKSESEALRKKAAKVANNKYAQGSDRKRAQYAQHKIGVRITKTAASVVAQQVIHDIFTGGISNYAHMSKKDIVKKVTGIATATAANVAINDALAKSAMKNYTDKGTTVRGTKRSNKLITKEDLIQHGIGVGVRAASIGVAIGGMKVKSAMVNRQKNEEHFKSWGKNILPQSTDNVIWSKDDMFIIDNRRK